MDRRHVLKGLGNATGLALARNTLELQALSSTAATQIAISGGAALAPAEGWLIETPAVISRLSEQTGDLIGLHWEDPDLGVIQEPRLGENFRLLLPQVGYEAAYFSSRDQHVSHIEATWDGVLCTYESLRREAVMNVPRVESTVRGSTSTSQSSVHGAGCASPLFCRMAKMLPCPSASQFLHISWWLIVKS